MTPGNSELPTTDVLSQRRHTTVAMDALTASPWQPVAKDAAMMHAGIWRQQTSLLVVYDTPPQPYESFHRHHL